MAVYLATATHTQMELTAIQNMIYEVRGVRVMLDFDLAEMYQVETRVLNQAVKRNIGRFPEDFMFQLNAKEWDAMSSQFVMTSRIKRPKTSLPFAFTEHGVIMLSSVLRSPVAVQVSIDVSRTFVAMRNYIMSTKIVSAELAEIRAKLELLEKNDEENMAAVNDLSEDVRKEIDDIYHAIAELSIRPVSVEEARKKIGFKTK